MVNRKTASALTIAALLACAIPVQSRASLMAPTVAQAAPSFSVPESVEKGTKVRVSSSSDNMNAISAALGKGFEKQYANSKVEVGTKDADAAIQDVLNDSADLAAISRPLTAEEKEKGLVEVPVRREKIAIVVGKDNAFAQSITGSQFAQIFRGEIKDWSEIGGTAGPIRVIDRPDASETRLALKPYPVFTTAEFKTGDTATQLSEDSTKALAKEIGKDGIGYALVGQLEGQSDIKAIELHKTLPDDPRYPFSQPYAFVYNGAATPAATAFLGYATGNPGQTALDTASLTGYGVLPKGAAANGTAADGTAANGTTTTAAAGTANESENADGNGTVDANGLATDGAASTDGTATIEGNAEAGNAESADVNADADGAAAGSLAAGRGRWWWLLLPLAGLGLLLWAAGKRGTEEETGYVANTRNDDDERIRNNAYRSGDIPNSRVGAGNIDASVGSTGVGSRVGRAVAGGTALAGGAAAAGAGLAGRAKNKAGDITMDLDGIKGKVQGGVDSTRGNVQGGLGNLRSNIQGGVQGGIDNAKGGIDGVRSNLQGGLGGVQGGVQGGIDGIKGNAQGGIDGVRSNLQGGVQGGIDNVQGGIDGVRGTTQGGLGNLKDSVKGGVDNVKGNIQGNDPDSWLDRAKQRINEATDQIKDSASDIKDDITKD